MLENGAVVNIQPSPLLIINYFLVNLKVIDYVVLVSSSYDLSLCLPRQQGNLDIFRWDIYFIAYGGYGVCVLILYTRRT